VAVIYGFGQVLEGFFLTPRLVGERIGLNPLAVIFACWPSASCSASSACCWHCRRRRC
jgi:hypothetical protein